MAKSIISTAPDAQLNVIKAVAAAGHLAQCACTQQPTTYTEATSTFKLAQTAMSSGDVTGPTTGDVSGRKIVMAQKATVLLVASGECQHLALVDTTNLALLAVTRTKTQTLTAGGGATCTMPSWKIEVLDPV